MIRKLASAALVGICLFSAACGGPNKPSEQIEPVAVYPDSPVPDAFNRAFTMTESADGTIRIFARDIYDATDLYETRLNDDGSWSEPERLDFEKRNTNTSPHFSPFDNRLYFASDRTIPGLEGMKDMNIWSMELTETGWGEAEPVPGNVNTSDNEISVATSADGHMFFASKQPGGQGGQDIYSAIYDAGTKSWTSFSMPEHVNSSRVESDLAVTPDGNTLVFYSFRQPKFGLVDIVAVSRTEDDTMDGWSEPYNLGPVINTRGIDFGASFSANGETFFFSRDGRLMHMKFSDFSKIAADAHAASISGKEREFLGLPELD